MSELSAPAPQLRRPRQGRVVAGVCAGLAAQLGVSPSAVRVTFAMLALLGGLGVVLYAALWITTPVGEPDLARPPGIDAATRQGRRPDSTLTAASPSRAATSGLVVSLAIVGVGAVMLLDRLVSTPGGAVWPIAVVAIGAAIVWRQAESREQSLLAVAVRVAVGTLLVVGGLLLFLAGQGELGVLLDALIAVLVVLAGIVVVTGPWLVRLVRDLQNERAERVRSQTRADMSAHLHDSVLQTLAVIQRQSGDPDVVARLARKQERDLRRWLYDEPEPGEERVRSALKRAAAEVEDAFGTPVEAVVVGDGDLVPGGVVDAVVAASREALTNAARHSGAARIDLFAEMDDQTLEVFVRDRGVGFDPAQVAADRRGVRGSIVERVQRHGGTATVTSEPGSGTEVRLTAPLQGPR